MAALALMSIRTPQYLTDGYLQLYTLGFLYIVLVSKENDPNSQDHHGPPILYGFPMYRPTSKHPHDNNHPRFHYQDVKAAEASRLYQQMDN